MKATINLGKNRNFSLSIEPQELREMLTMLYGIILNPHNRSQFIAWFLAVMVLIKN